ncbi:MAG: S41 family peptidase, partial [Simkania negevensis]|nr:S41 family peptidase [Simkania negevensis]
RIRERLEKQMAGKLKSRNIEGGDREISEKIFDFLEKKMERFEKEYSDLNEHLLTLHILKAFAKTLDAHTGYYSPKEAFEIRANLKKQFHGVGVVLRQDFDGVFIVSLIEGGPAQKSGKIQVGDQLIAINGTLVSGLAFDQLLEKMQGEIGTPLKLLVTRSSKEEEVKLVREKIIMNDERIAVSYEPYADGVIGRIDLPSFYDGGEQVNVERDLREAIKGLKQEGKLLGLVLDFRENSGGFLHQAVKVSKMFLKGGLIVISKYCDGEVSYSRDVDPRIYYDGPLVVLTSKASASAAEIVAQALQDHGVAIVVGDERTYGKGTMQYQTLTDESAKSFFKVTVGRYYTASGRSPQIEGVKADLVVPSFYFPYPIGERYLEFPLSNDHLSGEVFHSLEEMGRGTYQDLSKFPVPYLSPRESNWRKMLAVLKRSSSQRLAKDKNFQFFLKTAGQKKVERQSSSSQEASAPSNHGENDLQMAEAVQIIKDMVYLDRHALSY